MEANDIDPFVKYNYFHKEQKKSFKKNGVHAQICIAMPKKITLYAVL